MQFLHAPTYLGHITSLKACNEWCLEWEVHNEYFLFALKCLHCMQWSTELPVAGSSFTYVMASLGQLPAFLVTANMVHLDA